MVHVIAERLMGTVDVRRDQVEEWLLPAPLTTTGDALVVVSSFWTAEVECLAPASAEFTGSALTSASGLLAEATIDLFGSVIAGPLALASAVVEFDNTGSAVGDVALRPAVAEIAVIAPADQVAEIFGIIGVSIDLDHTVAVSVIADAEVEFAYYGNGNFPVFPYSFPALFTDWKNLQDAAALVEPTGVGVLDAVSGSAEAVLPAMTGAVGLTPRGSTPIFPWILPLVFDDLPANMNVGLARLLLDMDSPSVVVLDGEATVTIDAPGSSLPSAVFPWKFPVILIEAV